MGLHRAQGLGVSDTPHWGLISVAQVVAFERCNIRESGDLDRNDNPRASC